MANGDQSRWRAHAAPIIARVIAEFKASGSTIDPRDKGLRAAISAKYPFGERKYHPYKIWLSEVNRQLGTPLKTAKRKKLERQIEYTGKLVFGQRPEGF